MATTILALKKEGSSQFPDLAFANVSKRDTKYYMLIPLGTDGNWVTEHIEDKGDYDGNRVISVDAPGEILDAILKMLDDSRYGSVIITACSAL